MIETRQVREEVHKTLIERIMIFDGGMGTMIQNLELEEDDFRGKVLVFCI